MAFTPISKSQQRLTQLLSIQTDGTYDMAARALDAAGLPKDGIPSGHTWRTAGKLSDAELLALLPTLQAAAPVATASEARAERIAEYRERQERIREFYNQPLAPRHSDEGAEWFEPIVTSDTAQRSIDEV